MPIRVVVADDHRLLRESLRRLLDDAGLDVVGEAADGAAAVRVAADLRPHVVLMDVTMPHIDGITATRQLATLAPDTRVVLLTMHDDPEVVDRARRAGAAGYLFKDTALDEVVGAVQRAAQGALVLSPGVGGGDRWVEQRVAAVAGTAGDRPVLSSRESQIMQLVADGVRPTDIADRLVLAPKTVRNHLSRIYEKLGVNSRSDAVVEAIRSGFVRVD